MVYTKKKITPALYYFLVIFCFIASISCDRENFGDGKLQFFVYESNPDGKRVASSTVLFDTVFTSIGSIIRRFVAVNPSNSDITTDIFLAGGKQSNYSININGMQGNMENNSYFKNVTIPKKDSIFVFVKVNIDPTNQKCPFLVKDSIVFKTGTRPQDVKLIAYGQNAHYIVADPKTGYKIVAGLPKDGYVQDVTWSNELPYVVYGWALIDSACSLTIEPGTKVYFHNNSGLWAYRYSHLDVKGTLEEPVLFRGDRLESWFDEDFGSWNRIWINEGANANINYAVIRNAFIGVQVDPFPEGTITESSLENSLVNIENTIIRNTRLHGVLGRFLNVNMTNCVITENGESSLQLEGGKYAMKHLTVANYYSPDKPERKAPACYVSNLVSDFYQSNYAMNVDAEFTNCIITGRIETEVGVKKIPEADLKVAFQNCLVKTKEPSDYFIDCLRNVDPLFVSTDRKKQLDFNLKPNSPVIGKGIDIGVFYDIMGNPRSTPPDMGAYQSGR